MRRGDIVTIALQGDHGKPRPALIVQADPFRNSTHVALLPLTTSSPTRRLCEFRFTPRQKRA